MNSNIDFSDFNKISVEHPSKCRKITKHKFTIFAIILIIIIIILIIVYVNKSKKEKEKAKELNETNINIKELSDILEILKYNLTESNNTLNSLIDEFEEINEEINITKSKINDLEEENELLALEMEQKMKELDNLTRISNLIDKINETEQLLEIIKSRFSNLNIDSSNIQNDVTEFETLTSTSVKDKCYDSIVYGFNVERFYENCKGNPLLLLIKNDKKDKIGGYISDLNEERDSNEEDNSMIMNFDKNKYYNYNSNDKDKCAVFGTSNNFPMFGEDLIIYNEGSAQSNFPICYEAEQEDYFVNDKSFYIDILEVYKVEKN